MNLNLLPLAANAILMWDASTEPSVTSYRLYVGIQSILAGNPPLVKYVILENKFEVTGLDFGTKYFFVATAFDDTLDLESGPSNEVEYTPTPPPTPTPEPEPTPTPIDDGPGLHKGWFK